jgi:DNA gyrase subunit A
MTESGVKIEVSIEEELERSYLDYAMSVIIGRALPEVRDGLKPVHRRILYAMYKEGLLSGKKYSKCAGVVGEVLKKYHPHGDAAVYDALVRMAQNFNMRYPLIDGQGNFGSIDGDPPAAYRYTEARLSKLAEEMLADIEKETVDFTPNFDETTVEPVVLPSRIPNLLMNGANGIAVGMATNIPPHNLTELVNGLVALLDDPEITVRKLMKHIPGPDFPTGGIIHGREGVVEAYEKGKGLVQMRGKVLVETHPRTSKTNLVVTEIPYQLNKTRLIERIAELVREKKIEGINDIRDESDREGMRIVLELKKDAEPAVIRNQLYKHTPLQDTFGIINLVIVNGRPELLNLKQLLENFLRHRREVVVRRSLFDLKRAEEREHILLGLRKALDHLDEVIALIRKSKTPEEAKTGLVKKFEFSELQAQAILEMRLQRLTGLERQKILDELKDVQATIKYLKELLEDEGKIREVIKKELLEIRDKYGDARRTEIVDKAEDIQLEDLIAEEEMVVTISHEGYIKRNAVTLYRAQRRGGKGKMGMTTREEDFVEDVFTANTHALVLFFTNKGKVYSLKVYEIPQAGRAAKGKAIVNMLNLEKDEKLEAVLSIKEFEEGKYIVMATARGMVKKTELAAYQNIRSSGLIAIDLEDGDSVIAAKLTDGKKELLLVTRNGKAVRFKEEQVRPMGRATRGVIGIRMDKKDQLISMEVVGAGTNILTATENGFGKRTPIEEYTLHHRGGSGMLAMKLTERTGNIVGVLQVGDEDQIMLITNGGKIIRTKVKDVSVIGRVTQGVKLIELEQGEKVVGICRLAEAEEEDGGEEGNGEPGNK